MQASEVAIIGAGPIGLELAVALKRCKIDCLHFDAKQIGYTISWFPPLTQFFSSNERIAIAGVPLNTSAQGKATREEYLAYLRGVVEQFDLRINTYEPIVNIVPDANGFALTSQKRNGENCSYHCRKLILCTGGTDRPRRLNIPGEDLPQVSHYFQDPHLYFQTDLLIVGGKNSAVETALRCHHAGARVTLSYRREALPESSIKYWLMPEIKGLLKSGRIKSYFNSTPAEILPGKAILNQNGNRISVPADFVLLLIGYEQDNFLLKCAGVKLEGASGCPVYNKQTMETNIPGLYVAGTAVGGTQEKYAVFIENCHVHVERIVSALTGGKPPVDQFAIEMPES